MTKELLQYFNNDELSASVWLSKYALKNEKGEVIEQTPRDMHIRMAKELARVDNQYIYGYPIENFEALSNFGKRNFQGFNEQMIFDYLDRFKYIIPQGSIMSALGNPYKLQSLSSCFVVPEPLDSYGGIFKTDQEIAQLEKRRGGVGTGLNKLRPDDTPVMNAAGTSTGAHSFMDRFSNTTREVAQNGRRGALMLLMSILHPDIRRFITKKKDRTKVTGANISVQIIDEFMQAVVDGKDFFCQFPITSNLSYEYMDGLSRANGVGFDEEKFPKVYNKLFPSIENDIQFMRINAREMFDLIEEMAWENAEPGIAFMDRVHDYSPDGVYEQFKAIAANPCGKVCRK